MRENKNQNENQNEIVNENFNDIAKNNSKINKSISNMKRIILLIEIILSLIAIQCFRIALKK